MLKSHPPQVIARGREQASQGRFEGLIPVQMTMVVQKLVACDPEMKEALADTFEAVQEVAQTGPDAFHRIAVNTRAVGVTASIFTRAMVDCAMVIVGPGEIVDIVRSYAVEVCVYSGCAR